MKPFIFSLLVIVLPFVSVAQERTNDTGIVFGQSFMPDYTFKMSPPKGSSIIGQAEWTVQNGELVGKAKPGTSGGWLLLDSSYQDVGFHAVFKVTEGGETGVLFRLEKTGDGMNGILLSVNKSEVVPYRVSLDKNGKEIGREKLRYAGGIAYRMAPPVTKNDTFAPKGNIMPLRPLPAVNLPLTRPNTDLRIGEWNQVEVFLEENVIRTFLNDGREIGGAVDGDSAKLLINVVSYV